MTAPIEVTTKYATTVDSLADAWQFVMARIDSLGPDPRIVISPIWLLGGPSLPGVDDDVDRLVGRDDAGGERRQFEVVVEGMTHEVKS